MSRKRLGAIDPSRARDARAEAEAEVRERRRGAMGSGPPIAQMAADVGQSIDAELARLRDENAALAEKGADHDRATAEGRIVLSLALSDIDPHAILRDRRVLDREGEDWAALKASIQARGQQTPVDVIRNTGPGAAKGPAFGLVSGLRRWSVLDELYRETGDARFAHVLAFVRPLDAPVDKLVAMIEENEIRQDTSYFERGRICALAAGQGVFGDVDDAIATLFAASNRNRRYKIRAFASLHDLIGDLLVFPEAIGERLGLALVKALRGPGQVDRLRSHLAGRPEPFASAAEELALLSEFAAAKGAFAEGPAKPAPEKLKAEWRGGQGARVRAELRGSKVALTIEGLDGVDEAGLQTLCDWLGGRMQKRQTGRKG